MRKNFYLILIVLFISFQNYAYDTHINVCNTSIDDNEYFEENINEFPTSIMMDPLVVSLVCPATPGSDGSQTEQVLNIAVGATSATGAGSLTFPAGVYSSIPANAVINVSLTTTAQSFGASWLSELLINIDAPGTTADAANYQPSMTNGSGPETYTIDYGDFDPTGLWDFTIFDTSNDTGIDAEVDFVVTLTWSVPPIPSDCDEIVCGNSFILDTQLPGLTYNWSTNETTQSITVTQSGTYTVTVTDGIETAIDDIVILFGGSSQTNDINICTGQSHTVGTNTYTMTGTYTNVLTDYLGCDSTIITNLLVGDAGTTDIFPLVCDGGSFTIGTSTYTSSGNYTDVLTSYLGCDSTVLTHLTILAPIEEIVNVSICNGDTYMVGTSIYNATGTYADVLQSYLGCDSTIQTNLTVLGSINETDDVTICFGDSYVIGTSTYNADGSYTDILTSYQGCDSTVTTNLTVLSDIIENETLVLCFGESYSIGTSTYTMDGTYTDILVSYQGCDSTVNTTLTFLPENFTEDFVQICNSQTYTVGTSTYNSTGDYTDVLVSYQGCDSTILTHLTVVTEILEDVTLTICDGESHMVGTNTYTVSGDYVDMLTSVSGCDSTITTHLTVAPNIIEDNYPILCFGDTLFVGANEYTTSGVYTDILTTYQGCDSTVISNLTILDDIIEENTFILCASQDITVGTNTYTTSGDYTDVLTSYIGCDSLVITHLTVLNEIETINDIQICNGQSYTEGTNTYSTQGTYTDVYTSYLNCDSTVITNLTVVQQIDFIQNIAICVGESYTVGTNTYNVDGTYMDLFVAAGGCDSVVTTNLVIIQDAFSTQDISICFGESYDIGTSSYTMDGTYTDLLISSLGCDSTVTTNLTVIGTSAFDNFVQICANDVYTIGTSSYTMPGTYTDVLLSTLGCDSTVITYLDVVSVINTNEDVMLCEGESYEGFVYTQNTTLANVGTSVNGCDSIHTINIIVSIGLDVDVIAQDDICQTQQGGVTAAVFGGIAPYSYVWQNGNTSQFQSNLSAGTYTVTVADANGCTITGVGNVITTPQISIDYTTYDVDCNNNPTGAIDVEVVLGTAPYLYAWSGPNNFNASTQDINNLAAGMYTLIIYDASGCGYGTTIEVEQGDPLSVNVIPYLDTAIAATSGGTAPYQYSWSNGQNTPSITDVAPGTYYVTVEDANGCTIIGEGEIFSTAVNPIESLVSFNILPNPNNGRFAVEMELSEFTTLGMEIYDLSGRLIYQNEVEGTDIIQDVDLTAQNSGTYFLVINDGLSRRIEKILITK